MFPRIAFGLQEAFRLHEMLHAALMRQLTRFYEEPGKLSADEQAAVRNLEALMSQFLDMTFLREDPETARAASLAQAGIRAHMANAQTGDSFSRAAMVSEFVSWTLANQALAETLKTSKTRVKLSKLGALVRKAIAQVKRLLGLTQDRMSLFANIVANTEALLAEARRRNAEGDDVLVTDPIPGRSLNQIAGLPSDERIRALHESFQAKITDHLDRIQAQGGLTRQGNILTPQDEIDALHLVTTKALVLVERGQFHLDPEQTALFEKMVAAFSTTMQLDHGALVRVGKLYDHVIRNLTNQALMDDPTSNDPNDQARADARMRALLGQTGIADLKDLEKRPILLAVFLALSQAHPVLHRALTDMPLPKDREISFESTDALLTSAAESVMNTLATVSSGEGKSYRVSHALSRLSQVLGRIEQDHRTQLEKHAGSLLGRGDQMVVGWMQAGADKLHAWGAARNQGRTPDDPDIAGKLATAVSLALDTNKGEHLAKLVLQFNNTWSAPQVMKDLAVEVIGTTDENAGVNMLVNKGRSVASRVRQEFRARLPEIFAEQFSRELTDAEWSEMHLAFARTDVAAIGYSMSLANIRRMYRDPAALDAEIARAEAEVTKRALYNGAEILQDSAALARFMVKGTVDPSNHRLKTNAYAIARLNKENRPEVVRAVDRLVSLMAIRELDPKLRERIGALAQSESKGVDFLIFYMATLRENEQAKTQAWSDAAYLNAWKGYVPSETPAGASLLVADDSTHNGKLAQGYVRVGDYKGSGLEKGKKGYYLSYVSGRATYNQGALQTVHNSFFGVDPLTGYSTHGRTAGRVDKNDVGRLIQQTEAITQAGAARPGSNEVLIPRYDEKGQIRSFERLIDPAMLEQLNPNTHLGEMLGAWAGRQHEEHEAERLNDLLVTELGKRWEEDRREGRDGEYVNLADPLAIDDDPVLQDIWSMVPRGARNHAATVFGEQNVFMVRRDMLWNALGYRMPSTA